MKQYADMAGTRSNSIKSYRMAAKHGMSQLTCRVTELLNELQYVRRLEVHSQHGYISYIHSLVVCVLTPAPVQQLGRGERADPGVSQITLPDSDSIALNAWFQNVWQVSLTYEHSS